MAAKFELYKDKAGEYRFRLKAGNGEIILASEGYTKKDSAQHGIESVKQNAPDDARYERKDAKSGKPMFNLKARNGEVIGTSEQYESVAGRDHGIEAVKKAAPDATVHDLTH
ncbi:YegP family protein [Acetobacter cibinongensis]|nr:YegP family protein [Acetobacter cibinongensis]